MILREIAFSITNRHALNKDLVIVYHCRLEATKSAILPELVELTKDEESSVRVHGLETVVNVLSLLDSGKALNIT